MINLIADRMLRGIVAGALLFQASSAAANPFIAEGQTPAEVLAIIADMCMDNSDNLTEASSSIVVCEGQAKRTIGSTFLGSLLFGARAGQMKLIMRSVALPHPAGARVRIQITMEADKGRGTIERFDWSEDWKEIMPRTIAKAGLVPQVEWEAAHITANTTNENLFSKDIDNIDMNKIINNDKN